MEQILLPSQNGNEQSPILSVAVNNSSPAAALAAPATPIVSSSGSFIMGNTEPVSFDDLKHQHLIPTYKDSEPLISHADFVEITQSVVHSVFPAERILIPSIRLSHEVLGRVPEAKDKPAAALQEWERTKYYERMMFVVEIPSISDTIDNQALSLTVGGVRVYSGMHQRKGADECFQIFAGFRVKVCSNLSVWSDGFAGSIRVKNLEQLAFAIRQLISSYDAISNLKQMEQLQQYGLTEQQFAHLIGRCKMYQYLPAALKKDIPELKFHDTQINMVCRDYFKDQSFCRTDNGEINLWRLYNLFTSANKSTYIDQFLDKSVNASGFVSELAGAVENKSSNWFLS